MITVHIGSEQFDYPDVDEARVNQEIRRLSRGSSRVCVRIDIEEPNAHLSLATPGCFPSAGGGRRPNETEQEILDLWRKRHLDSSEFTGGELVAFLKHLRNIL